MKKTFVILLSFVYLSFTSGVAMTVHYCMGEVAAVGIGHKESDSCGTCGMEHSGCCHDDFKVVKVSDFHGSPNQPSLTYKVDWTATPAPSIERIGLSTLTSLPKSAISHAPPDPSGRALCILHCVYRI